MQHLIFYSWQADRSNNTNRSFIKAALEEAAAALATDLTVEPRIDHDTQNVPGSPDIARTILKKIETSHVFVADATIITDANAPRPTPNPNVLIELGYAMHALGEDRVILVMNDHYGPVEQLPFDLRARRTIIYTISQEAEEKANERHRLAAILKAAIKAAIESIPPPPPTPNATDSAITAIEHAAPNRTPLLRTSMQEITSQLERLAPPPFGADGTVDTLIDAITATAPVVRKFTLLSRAIATMNDNDAARALWKAFRPLLEHYDNPRGFTGRFDERDFDYWRFLGHELLTTLIAALLTEERYPIIKDLMDDPITLANHNGPITYEYASEHLRSLEQLNEQRRRLSVHADLLHERHARADSNGLTADGPLADVLTFDDLLAADYLLWLRGELSPDEPPTDFFAWIPWSSVYLRDAPTFLHNAVRATTAAALASALNTPGVPVLKQRLGERAARLQRLWRSGMWRQPVRNEHIENIGSRP